MINSTYNPLNQNEFDKTKIQVADKSVQGVCPAGETASFDVTLADDHLLMGLQILAKNSNFGDTLTLQVIDIAGTLPNGASFPPNTVLAQFGTTIGVCDDKQEKLNERSVYPAKLLAGLSIRLVYTSTGTTDVNVIANYILHKVLV